MGLFEPAGEDDSAPPTVSRRCLIRFGAAALLAGGWSASFARTARTRYSRRALELVGSSLVIDMLAPLTLDLSPDAWAKPLSELAMTEFRTSGAAALHHAFGLGGRTAHEDVLAYLAGWQGHCARHPDTFLLADRAEDIERAKATGRVAVIMGIQNADHFRSTKDVSLFYQLGQRCSQLTYNSQNLLGSGSTERVDGGLTDFGAEIVAEMARVGMLIDVSHSGDRTTLDAVEAAPGPIAFTHGNCRALAAHPRNKTDEAIRALARKGGVMGITGVRMFVTTTEPTTIRHVADHIDHVARLVGIEHVGIGTDADLNGYDDMRPDQYAQLKAAYKTTYAFRDRIDVEGFDHPRKFFDLTEELIRRRYSDENIRAVLGGNFRRLLGTTWKPATMT